MTLEEVCKVKLLTGSEDLTIDEMNMLMDNDDEMSRRGNFQKVFPLHSSIDYYERFFENKRYNNYLLWAYIKGGQ